MQSIKAKRLIPGDAVGIVSPSEPITADLRPQLDNAVASLESFGLKVKFAPHAFSQHYYNAGTRAERIGDFNQTWSDPEIKMVLMSQGGETANHLLAGIDYAAIQSNPKIFAGISDGTTLLNAIYAKTGLITYHGPDLLWTFGRDMSEPFRKNFYDTFFSGEVAPFTPNPNWQHQEGCAHEYRGWRVLRPGKACGILMGGHSGCLSSLMVAGYAPNFKGALLFLEGTDLIGYLDRQWTALELGGVFKQISGLVIGWFDKHALPDQTKTRHIADVVLEALNKYDFPILEIGELGHNVENFIFPIGCRASLDTETLTFRLDESSVA